MAFLPTLDSLRRIVAVSAFVIGGLFCDNLAFAQGPTDPFGIDPRLIEVTRIVKQRSLNQLRVSDETEAPTQDGIYLDLVDKMQTSFYSRDPDKIQQSVRDFHKAYQAKGNGIDLAQVAILYTTYANSLNDNVPTSVIQGAIEEVVATGNWFEKYCAYSMAAHLHANSLERQAALQKAQLALSQIPTKPNPQNFAYVQYAKAHALILIAHLHNLQGNSELALATSLNYLNLTRDNPNLEAEVDLVNNLIYSYSRSRNHEAQLYLSKQLLDIEEIQSSSVPGLSEMRISGVMNSSGQYADALDYAERSLAKVTHPVVRRLSQVSKGIALAGLGDIEGARSIGLEAQVNFDPEYLLKNETGGPELYLAFLIAQSEDTTYATQLFNRQLDVNAQKFYSNNSRDTTAMLAELENSRERQAEREAATAREAKLQAMTISRQRNLNRALIFLSVLLGGAALAAVLFTRFRGRIMRKLEIKTREAASAEKLKTEFLGMISHELRTPLNGIIGISDYLANYHNDPDIRQKTGIILKGGNELLSVVESLTDMARIDAGQLTLAPHDVDLGADLAEIPQNWTDKAAAKNLAFTHFIDPAITRHHVDGDRIVQCVNILLANAISFTEAGRVHLHVTASKSPPNELCVVVADTGQGMTELVQSRLFTPFMQADTSRKRTHMGTGLNLAIAYALVEMMGGTLSCVSRAGRGSEFTFHIPLPEAITEHPVSDILQTELAATENIESGSKDFVIKKDPLSEKDSAASDPIDARPILPSPVLLKSNAAFPVIPAPVLDSHSAPSRDYVDLMKPAPMRPALHDPTPRAIGNAADASTAVANFSQPPKRILIVDDIDNNRDVLRLILESKGHVCGEAADGFTALTALDRKSYDFVILDIHMAPLDGIETLRRIRNSGKPYENICVIALTADNAPSVNAETMDAGADLFLAKPIQGEDLLDAIHYLSTEDRGRILSQKA